MKNAIHKNQVFLAAMVVGAMTAPISAEDIDLFQTNPPNSNQKPNVLFLIDNTANWNSSIGDQTKRSLEHGALATIFQDRPATVNGEANEDNFEERMRVGFMVFSDGKPDGGKVVEAVELLTDDYREHLRQKFEAGINNTDAGLPKTNNASYALSMHEAYLYFGGREPRAGGPTNKKNEIQADPDAFTDSNGSLYTSPADLQDGSACYNYLVVIGNGQPDTGENSGGTPENLLRGIGGNTDTIGGLNPDDYESIVADEYSRFFNNSDVVPDTIQAGEQNLRTYVIDVFNPDSNKERTRKARAGHAFLQSIANQTGDDAYYAVHSAGDLLEAINDVLDKIFAKNTVFAASALPVSVNVRGTNLNQIYIGVFRPDANQRTRWFGNLKLYQLNANADTNNVFLADVNGNPAQDSETGFIRDGATSFWTHASTYWEFSPRGEPASGSDAPDGAVVEKGGVAQRLRELPGTGDYTGRRAVYTCTGGCNSGSLLSDFPFLSSNSGVGLETDLIDWIRGEDNHVETAADGASIAVDEDDDGANDDARASIHGDVLHSQPAIINYGTDGNEDVVVYYGANDGMIHAVTGGTDQNNGGQPLWSFVPPEFFGELDDLRQNTEGKTYFADGDFTAYVMDNDGDREIEPNDGDRALLYTTMRRGGRFIYAFDVTDADRPKFLWKISNNTPGFSELGQSWSNLSIGRLQGMDAPVALFGAGYDPAAEDANPDTGQDNSAAATQGRGLFVINALTGGLIWQVGPDPDSTGGGESATVSNMQFSMPAGVTAIDRDRDGFLDRAYIPDTGGQVWRINLVGNDAANEPDPASWEVHRLANVGDDQEFQYAVDVVAATPTDIYSDRFDAILVGSGDRENPFDTTITNRFYMFKDVATDGPGAINSQKPLGLTDLFDATDNVVQDGTQAQQQAAISQILSQQGWYITLANDNPNADDADATTGGEKVVGGATTLAGTTFFNTNTPTTAITCAAALGESRGYAVNFRDGSATLEQDGQAGLKRGDRYKEIPGGGFPPTPVPALVSIDDKQYLAICSGTDCKGGPTPPLGVRERVYWYNEQLDQ